MRAQHMGHLLLKKGITGTRQSASRVTLVTHCARNRAIGSASRTAVPMVSVYTQ